jgi:hypothetical protein
MSTTLQDSLAALADGAAARAGRSDDEARRATLGDLVGTVRRRRAVRHAGSAVAGSSLIAALAVGGSQLAGGRDPRPGEIGPGGMDQAEQLSLVNSLGIQCGKPFTLNQTDPVFTSPGVHQPHLLIGSQKTGFSLRMMLGDPENPPAATTPWSFATIITLDGQTVGFGAGRPTTETLVKNAEGWFDFRFKFPSLMNCKGVDAATPDDAYQMYILEGQDDAKGIPRLVGVLGPAQLPIVNGAPGYPPGSPSFKMDMTESAGILGTQSSQSKDTMAWTVPELGGRDLVIRFQPDGSFPREADGTIQLWIHTGTETLTPYSEGTYTASYMAASGAVEIKRNGVLLETITQLPIAVD